MKIFKQSRFLISPGHMLFCYLFWSFVSHCWRDNIISLHFCMSSNARLIATKEWNWRMEHDQKIFHFIYVFWIHKIPKKSIYKFLIYLEIILYTADNMRVSVLFAAFFETMFIITNEKKGIDFDQTNFHFTWFFF